MKNYLKRFCFCVVCIIFSANFFAQENAPVRHNFSLSLKPSFGLLIGHGEEIVYRNSTSIDKLSQLFWELKPLAYFGIELNASRKNPQKNPGVFGGASFKIGIPAKTGKMEDRDWLYTPDDLTHYSVSTNKTNQAVLGDAHIGALFAVSDTFSVKPSLVYSFMFFSWTASGGSALYPGGHVYYPSSTDVVAYTQMWNIVAPAIAVYKKINALFAAEFSFKITPVLWYIGVDDHFLRDLRITDTAWGGIFVEPAVLFSYTPTRWVTLSFSASLRKIWTRGNSHYEPAPVGGVPKNISGAGYQTVDVSIAASVNFF